MGVDRRLRQSCTHEAAMGQRNCFVSGSGKGRLVHRPGGQSDFSCLARIRT
jgi:hypothetical protein